MTVKSWSAGATVRRYATGRPSVTPLALMVRCLCSCVVVASGEERKFARNDTKSRKVCKRQSAPTTEGFGGKGSGFSTRNASIAFKY